MNRLRKVAEKNPGLIRRLAVAADVSDSQMSRIFHGLRGASLDVALVIEDETDGLVTVRDVAAARKLAQKKKTPQPRRKSRAP